MNKLIAAVLLALGVAGGWWAGGWSGRDAKEKLAEAERKGEAAAAALKEAQEKLKTDLAAQQAQFDAERAKLTEAHAKQTSSFEQTIKDNKGQIETLQKQAGAKQQQVAQLQQALKTAATPEERKRIEDQIQVVQAEQKAVEVEIDGRRCLPVPVPLAVLADWRAVKP